MSTDARKRRPPKGTPRAARLADSSPTEVTFGLRAGLAVLARRPDEVLEVACSASLTPELRRGRSGPPPFPLRQASDAALAHLTGSTHHEGLAVVARPRRWVPAAQLSGRLVEARGVAVALDRVRNPYNVGAILRTAAFFGVDAALFGAIAPQPALAPDAVRVAEGGVEHLLLSRTTDLADTLGRLAEQGVRIVGAEGAARESALSYPFRRPSVLVMGHEREGLSPRVRARCEALVAIPGTGAVESLNVAVAAGILLRDLLRG